MITKISEIIGIAPQDLQHVIEIPGTTTIPEFLVVLEEMVFCGTLDTYSLLIILKNLSTALLINDPVSMLQNIINLII